MNTFTTKFRLLFLFIVMSNILLAQYSGGDGSVNNPFKISSITDLETLSADTANWDMNFILTTDINASATQSWNSGAGFSPIGDYFYDGDRQQVRFDGTFNGLGHTIDSLYINRPNENYVGLFGFVMNATISNLYLNHANVSGLLDVGGLIGWFRDSDMTKCYSINGTINGTDNNVGGLIGLVFGGNIDACYASGNATGVLDNVGGFVGFLNSSSNITANISNCFAATNATADNYAAGFVGNYYHGSISNCYATGAASADYGAGGFIGYLELGSVSNCYYDTETTEQPASSGGSPLSTNAFASESSFSGWNFSTIWEIKIDPSIDNNSRPYLRGFLTGDDGYTVTFSITEGDTAIEGALVSLTGYGDATTDAAGTASFSNVLPANEIEYSVMLDGYVTSTGSISVVDNDVTIELVLYGIIEHYMVNFIVSDGNSALEGATVALSGYGEATTDTTGMASFVEVLPANDIEYTITLDGYLTSTGSVSVIDSNINVNVIMTPLAYDVRFMVSNGTTMLEGALVALTGYGEATSDTAGYVTFTNVLPANDIEYTVTLDGYVDTTGHVSVVDKNIEVDIILEEFVGIDFSSSMPLSIYPNPCHDYVKINFGNQSISSITIYNAFGKVIITKGNYIHNEPIDITTLDAGIYIIKVESKNNTFATTLIKK